RHRIRHLDHDAVRVLEPVDDVGLERPAPGEELLREVAGDADGGMDGRFWPSAGWRTRLRARSPGVWIAPAATTTSGARTRTRPCAASPSRSRSIASTPAAHPL